MMKTIRNPGGARELATWIEPLPVRDWMRRPVVKGWPVILKVEPTICSVQNLTWKHRVPAACATSTPGTIVVE